jgi:hypothetical protein
VIDWKIYYSTLAISTDIFQECFSSGFIATANYSKIFFYFSPLSLSPTLSHLPFAFRQNLF